MKFNSTQLMARLSIVTYSYWQAFGVFGKFEWVDVSCEQAVIFCVEGNRVRLVSR
jgi:hypothetical protein